MFVPMNLHDRVQPAVVRLRVILVDRRLKIVLRGLCNNLSPDYLESAFP